MKRVMGMFMFVGSSFAVFTIVKHKQEAHSSPHKKEYITSLDSILSTSVQQEIAHFVDAEFKNKTDDQGFVELLVQRFPFVENVALEKLPSGISHIEIKASNPKVSVNEQSVLTHDNHIVSKNIFQPYVTEDLFSLYIKSSLFFPHVNKELQQTIAQLPAHLFENFSIVLHNETECFLYDTINPQFAILFNSTTIPDQSLLNHCIELKNEIEQRVVNQNSKKKNKKIYVADVRFKNQIIVRPSIGPNGHTQDDYDINYKKLNKMEGQHHG